MGIDRVFKRIVFTIIFFSCFVILFVIIIISKIRLNCTRDIEIPVSKDEIVLFKEIEQETGFVIMDSFPRRIEKQFCDNYLIYEVEFYRKEPLEDSILKKQSMKFYSLLTKKSELFNYIMDNNDKIEVYIDYNKSRERPRKGIEFMSRYAAHSLKIEKDKHFLYDWNKKDTIFLK